MGNEQFIELMLSNNIEIRVDNRNRLKLINSRGFYIAIIDKDDSWSIYSSIGDYLNPNVYMAIIKYVTSMTNAKLDELKKSAELEK